MIDTDDTTDTADGGAVELALRLIPPEAWQMVFALVKIAVDPRTTKRNLRSLHDALAATTQGQAKLAAERATFDEYERTTRAELAADRAKLREGQVALATAKDSREDRITERERRIGELERRWRFIGEDDDVISGFRAAEFSALYKARSAFGYASDAQVGLDDIAEHMREKFPPSRTVRTGNVGESFPPGVTLTRSPEQPAGVRVRPGRKSAPLPPEAA